MLVVDRVVKRGNKSCFVAAKSQHSHDDHHDRKGTNPE